MFYRDSWIEINLDQFKENIQWLRKTTGKEFFAVIKANGYGAGDGPIARAALEAGAAYLAVSSLDEALSLRSQGISAPILILGYVNPAYAPLILKHQLTVPAVSLAWVQELVQYPITGMKIHLKIDTGMNRIGSHDLHELQDMLALLCQAGAETEGVFTHFACSDNPDNAMTDGQYQRFIDLVTGLKGQFRWIHCCNSDAAVHYPDHFGNAVRCGLAMFGITSYPTPMKPCLALYSRLIHIKALPAGQPVGYGATYETQNDNEWIGTLPIGYADGWIRRHQGRCCWAQGAYCEFVGRICMDQAMIRLPHSMPVGTQVELIGPHIPIEQAAEELGTIPYEVMTLLSDRLAKVYIENGAVIGVSNPRLDRMLDSQSHQ